MTAEDFRSPSEKTLYRVCVAFSFLVWAGIAVTIVGLFYGLFMGLFLFAAHALFIAYLKGNGVKLSETQLPDVYRRVVEASRKLGLPQVPETYVMQAEGALNAFATKFVGRNFVVLYSDLLEACDENGREADMIIGHEIGHLALGHLKFIWFLLPAHLIPWLWPAYSRQREYSCDICGYHVTEDFDSAARGLAILAAGGKYGKQVNLESFTKQIEDTRGFWTSVYELNASHPFLPKRIAALVNYKNPGSIPETGRHALAYPLAPLFAVTAPGGGGAIVMVMIIAVLAAVAIPQFAAFKERAETATMDSSLREIHKAAAAYRTKRGRWPCKMDQMKLKKVRSLAGKKNWELVVNCNDALAAVVYNGKDGKRHYRAISFDSSELESGLLPER